MRSLKSLFDIDNGHQLALNRVTLTAAGEDSVAYVTRSHRNNGILGWVEPIPGVLPAKEGNISVCLRSRNHALCSFVQPHVFYTTYHVAVLTPKSPMTLQEKLWWCLCIRANRFRFHFGRQANRTLGDLLLPDNMPQWAARIEIPVHDSRQDSRGEVVLDSTPWHLFSLMDLFAMEFGPHTSRRPLGEGETPLISASAWNNGVSAFVGVDPQWAGGQITVANNGSVGAAFFQPRPFTASRDVTVLSPKLELSPASALFICTVLRKESARFNYARKWNAGRMKDYMIRLPAKDGLPDVTAMEQFMLRLPLGWALKAS